jgi:hypothetical protein
VVPPIVTFCPSLVIFLVRNQSFSQRCTLEKAFYLLFTWRALCLLSGYQATSVTIAPITTVTFMGCHVSLTMVAAPTVWTWKPAVGLSQFHIPRQCINIARKTSDAAQRYGLELPRGVSPGVRLPFEG